MYVCVQTVCVKNCSATVIPQSVSACAMCMRANKATYSCQKGRCPLRPARPMARGSLKKWLCSAVGMGKEEQKQKTNVNTLPLMGVTQHNVLYGTAYTVPP